MNTNPTRESFLSLFSNESDAIAFEQQALSIGEDLLPAEAVDVLRFGSLGFADYEPAPSYWAWLCEQVEVSRQD